MESTFDVVVIGAGPGGYVAAVRAAQLGKKVAIVEAGQLGGVCLNVGCIPAKTLLHNAALVRAMTHEAEALGLPALREVASSYPAAVRRSRRVADGRSKGIEYLFRKNKITVFRGWARFSGTDRIAVTKSDGAVETVAFSHCIIATGAQPRSISGVKFGSRIVSYRERILSDQLPGRLTIVGGGAIGVEFAYLMNAYGVRVQILEFGDRLLPSEDAELSDALAKSLTKQGIEVFVRTEVLEAGETSFGAWIRYRNRDTSEESTLETDEVLVAIGFEANTDHLGLDQAGISTTKTGSVAVNEHLRTSNERIWAIGDVTGLSMLAHVAETMAVAVAERIAGLSTGHGLNYVQMPRATFTKPQIASIGLTEAQARQMHGEVKVSKFPFLANGKAQALGEPGGFCKLIASPDGRSILGAHLIGGEVAELLPAIALAMRAELSPDAIAETVHLHPSLGEAVKEAALGLNGVPINM